MSTTITAPEPIEPDNELPVPSPGQDVNQWGDILNEETFPMLLAYILWLKENIGGSPAAEDVTYDNGTSGLAAEDVQSALDELAGVLDVVAGVAGTALQPGDELTELSSGAATAGHVPTANGSGGITWAAQTGGGGGGIAPADGLVVVQHGAVAATARPAAATVYWMGSVAPTNRVTGDLWLETDAFDGGG